MLNLYHLKYFCDAARMRSLSEAARINRVSHSAISQAIRSLEGTLDVQLLKHGKRKFEISKEGSLLLAHSEEVFGSVHSLGAALTRVQDVVFGPLRIGLSHSVGMSFISGKLIGFCGKHAQVAPSLRVGNSRALERLLDTREIELGFGIDDGHFASYERVVLHSGCFVLVAGRGARKRGFPHGKILLGDKGREVKELRGAIKKAGHVAEFVEIESWSMIADFASQGMGAGLIPDFILNQRKSELTQVRLKFELPSYELCAFFRNAPGLSAAAAGFLESLRT